MNKPAEIFDREFEWAELVRFASYQGPEATLGIVSGHRRQGKTFLLTALCQATDGFYFAATEATEPEATLTPNTPDYSASAATASPMNCKVVPPTPPRSNLLI
ncbi:MAG: hypothetical protein ACREP9_21275 [Candidatus Dormibacteraceae bacterium]